MRVVIVLERVIREMDESVVVQTSYALFMLRW